MHAIIIRKDRRPLVATIKLSVVGGTMYTLTDVYALVVDEPDDVYEEAGFLITPSRIGLQLRDMEIPESQIVQVIALESLKR